MVTPLKYIPLFLQLLALTKKNCVSVPEAETALTDACTKLLASVAQFKAYLAPVQGILPSTSQMSELEEISWNLPSTNDTTKASKHLIQIFLETISMNEDSLPGDEVKGNIFSPERVAFMKKELQEKALPAFGRFDLVEMQVAGMLQSRLSRQESANFFRWSKVMSGVILVPQIVLLLFISVQFVLLKIRERKLKKHTRKMTRERSMMRSLLHEIRSREGGDAERPGVVELM